MTRPLLIVITAPSGAGKTTLCDRLLDEFENIVYSVSCTTRSPRGEEVDGEDYFFLADESFDAKVADGLFLEHAVVHDYKYGTLKSSVSEVMDEGDSVLMDIDVQGARQIREAMQGLPEDSLMKNGFIDIFITPPSLEELSARLYGRGEDEPEVIEKRLQNAVAEMECEDEFSCVIVNDDVETAYRRLRDIIETAMG